MTVARVIPRGWRRQLRDGLPSDQAVTIVGIVGTCIAAAIAALAWGHHALTAVLAAAVLWLIWDRGQLLDRADKATDDADRALGLAQAACDHLAGTEPDSDGRHARRNAA